MYTNNSPQGNAAYGGQQQQGGGMYSQQGGNAGNMGNMQQQQGQQGQPAMRHGGGLQQQNQNQSMLGSDQADMMLNFGMNQGSAMLKQQQEKWMPGVSGFWQSLKIYFAVNNVYVVKKLSMILYPLGVKSSQSWIRKNAEDGGYDVSPTTQPLLCCTTLHLPTSLSSSSSSSSYQASQQCLTISNLTLIFNLLPSFLPSFVCSS
jgi:hypothetical protein